MAASLARSTPSASGVKVHRSFSTGELQCAKRTAVSSPESPCLPRADWSLSLEKPQETLFNAGVGRRELRGYKWNELHNGKYAGLRSRNLVIPVNAIASDDPAIKSSTCEGKQAWDILIQDLQFCDWKARRDVLAIKTLHDKVVDALNPMARDRKSVHTLHKELADMQSQLAKAHDQVHLSEVKVSRALAKLSAIESSVNKLLLQEPGRSTHQSSQCSSVVTAEAIGTRSIASPKKSQRLMVAGPVTEFSPALKNFWYPVAFTDDISKDTMVPFESFEEPWVLFRGPDGRAGCVRNSCAHRACPLHLGEVKDGRIQCPYHGWEYATNGVCEKMPSTKPVKVSIQALPCVEHDGLVWIWPGDGVPSENLPDLNAPAGYTTHAQIIIELPVEHGLLMENLLDLAHAPFTHTSTFAKGWPVPSLVKFCTPATALQGYWDPYPIDMAFQPPCMVRSTIGISKPGKLEGSSTQDCAKHLHQLHVCLPSSRGKTRLLYRLSLDFLPILKLVPYIQSLWKYLANKVLDEDLRLVLGQQDRMIRGANVWNLPVSYDKLGVRYRKWRMSVEQGDLMQNDSCTHTPSKN